jgi:hypothetical protein
MPGEVLVALAQWAGQTVAAAAVTDVWESARHKIARLLGRGDANKTEVAERWLAQTHEQLTAAAGAELEPARATQAQRWAGRFADLLDENPGIETDLRALVQEIAAQRRRVRLAPRPVFLAGREELLAELGARLASTKGEAGP